MIRSIAKPERFYIGSSCHVYRRRNDHKSSLRLNKHESVLLQNHYNKYGESDLEFMVLRECGFDELRDVEQGYLDSMNPPFNVLKTASWHNSYKLKKKRGKGTNLDAQRKATQAAQKFNKRPVLQYAENGVLIKEWPSITEACQGIDINRTTLDYALRHGGYTAGFYWCFKDGPVKNQITPAQPGSRRLFQYDFNGRLINVYNGSTDAETALSLTRGQANNAACGRANTGGGFIWSWEIPYEGCYCKIFGKKPSQELIDAARERYYMEYGHPNSSALKWIKNT